MTVTLGLPRARAARAARAVQTALAALTIFLGGTAALAQVSVGIALPGVNIGINVPVYPRMIQVPGHPVYYAPQSNSNYFFYDGLYWVYQNDRWYESSWYNGPWQGLEPEQVPVYLLRVPVRYYRAPPGHFHGWGRNSAPRWGEHWGPRWQQAHGDWDRPHRNDAVRAAPLPVYQQPYYGARYPYAPARQEAIRVEQYRFRPQETVTQQRWEQHERRAVAPEQRESRDKHEAQGHGRDANERDKGKDKGKDKDHGKGHDKKGD